MKSKAIKLPDPDPAPETMAFEFDFILSKVQSRENLSPSITLELLEGELNIAAALWAAQLAGLKLSAKITISKE